MIHEFTKPIPVVTPEGDGYAIYVSDSGMLENDTWCVALCKDGQLLHFNTKQLRIGKNATFGIGVAEINFGFDENFTKAVIRAVKDKGVFQYPAFDKNGEISVAIRMLEAEGLIIIHSSNTYPTEFGHTIKLRK